MDDDCLDSGRWLSPSCCILLTALARNNPGERLALRPGTSTKKGERLRLEVGDRRFLLVPRYRRRRDGTRAWHRSPGGVRRWPPADSARHSRPVRSKTATRMTTGTSPTSRLRTGCVSGVRRGPSRKLGPTVLPLIPGICPNGVAASSGSPRRSTPIGLPFSSVHASRRGGKERVAHGDPRLIAAVLHLVRRHWTGFSASMLRDGAPSARRRRTCPGSAARDHSPER